MKPKPLSKARRKWLEMLSQDSSNPPAMRWSREVLAALEYERQRADAAEKKAAEMDAPPPDGYTPAGWV